MKLLPVGSSSIRWMFNVSPLITCQYIQHMQPSTVIDSPISKFRNSHQYRESMGWLPFLKLLLNHTGVSLEKSQISFVRVQPLNCAIKLRDGHSFHVAAITHTAIQQQLFYSRLSGTRRIVQTLTPITIINHPSSTAIHGILPVQSACLTVVLHNVSLTVHFGLSLGMEASTSYSITSLHTIIIFFLQHMPIPKQPVLLQ